MSEPRIHIPADLTVSSDEESDAPDESLTPRQFLTLSQFEDLISVACNTTAHCVKVDLRHVEHDRRKSDGVWIQTLVIEKTREVGRFRVTLRVAVDNQDQSEVLYAPHRLLLSSEIASWYLRFTFHCHLCTDCSSALVSKDDAYCPRCLFDHLKVVTSGINHDCSLCNEPATSELHCGHAMHRRCYRAYSRHQPLHISVKCPECRAPLSDFDVLAFVPASWS